MTKTEILLVRACKALDAEKRIRSWYRHFYFSKPNLSWGELSFLLLNFTERYCPINTTKLIQELSPEKAYKYPSAENKYHYRLGLILISHIRLAEVSKLNGFILGVRWRRNNV